MTDTSGVKDVLVVMSDARARRAACRAIAATGARFVSTGDIDEALQTLERAKIDLVVVDWDNAPRIARPDPNSDKTQVVLLTNRPIFERHAEDIMVFPLNGVIVQSFVAMNDDSDIVSTRELVTTVAKLFTGDILGLEKYLGWGAAITTLNLRSSQEAHEIVNRVSECAATAGMFERDRSNLGMLIDELLMNAIWDAPVDEDGKPKYHSLSRAQPIDLLPGEVVTLRYGSDGNVFGVSVTDRFGRLEQDLAVSYIKKCFRLHDQGISEESGGSGLGLYMAYNAVSSFIINVQPGRCTEVIGLIRLGKVRRPAEMQAISRSLCYFRDEELPLKG